MSAEGSKTVRMMRIQKYEHLQEKATILFRCRWSGARPAASGYSINMNPGGLLLLRMSRLSPHETGLKWTRPPGLMKVMEKCII